MRVIIKVKRGNRLGGMVNGFILNGFTVNGWNGLVVSKANLLNG
jgi:hypothetical protein